jgi:hypothetical protein
VGGRKGEPFGAFLIPHPPTGAQLHVIASSGWPEKGINWEHVSVSLPRRCPNWPEMEFICRLFWTEDECVMQLHPPRSQWISNHRHALHLWRPTDIAIPQPPGILVGVASEGELQSPEHARQVREKAQKDFEDLIGKEGSEP